MREKVVYFLKKVIRASLIAFFFAGEKFFHSNLMSRELKPVNQMIQVS